MIKEDQVHLYEIKIALYENKEDYVEAFLMYLNSDVLKVKVFKWLTDTIEKLKIIEKEWKQNNIVEADDGLISEENGS